MSGAHTDFPVAILAGGLATRLRPVTEKIPKLLVEVAGEPFLSHQLRLLRQNGLTRIVLCVGHLGDLIVEHYGNGAKWGVHIDYSFDGEKLLGTGGALIRALPLLGDAFYVLYGDSFLPINYQAVGRTFLAAGKLGLMTVYENRGAYDTSNVWFEDGRIRRYAKTDPLPQMRHIDYGLGVFRPAAFADQSPGTVVDLAVVQSNLCTRGELSGYESPDRFFEIGSPAGLKELDEFLRTGLSPR
ncbi:MAG: nucleotidyltransferase family protein [Cephaloticoccus sp.]|nr:nucleotidyltransferase family protein [Cephaloticoccus sp.]MCF7760831.1 nucleotidyltransferase family protein [Cephaloticoccus sp.]